MNSGAASPRVLYVYIRQSTFACVITSRCIAMCCIASCCKLLNLMNIRNNV